VKTLLRLPQVRARVGLSRSALYAQIARREFPGPIKIGSRAAAWVETEVEDWITRRVEQSRTKAG